MPHQHDAERTHPLGQAVRDRGCPSLAGGNDGGFALAERRHMAANQRMQQLSRQVETMYIGFDAKTIVRRLRDQSMRVMGITSHYTTFLKYSMSDWLDAMDTLGHETRMVMEEADHQIANPLFFAEAIIDFKPDLILMIDHYRAEIPGLPRQIPCVMWVQDNLPNIFSAKAGAAGASRLLPRVWTAAIAGPGRLSREAFSALTSGGQRCPLCAANIDPGRAEPIRLRCIIRLARIGAGNNDPDRATEPRRRHGQEAAHRCL